MGTQLAESSQPLTAATRANGGEPARQRPDGVPSREVARAMVRVFKDCVGRGPGYARAYIHDDVIFVILRCTMTTAEQTLVDEGEEALVCSMRQALQGKLRGPASGIIERLTGRRVCASLSSYEVDEDTVVQTFILEG